MRVNSKRNLTIISLIVIIISLYNYYTLTTAVLFSLDGEINIVTFDAFDLFNDEPLILSQKNSSSLTFSYEEQSLPSGLIDDIFLYTFDALGNCSDFNINVTVTYSFFGSVMGALLFRLGSYHAENGSLWGKDFNPTERIDDDYGYISTVSIRDVWVSEEGTYRVVAHPNDQKDLYETSTPPLANEGSVSFHITRIGGILTCLISSTNGEQIISHTWTEGVTKPLNYIVIDFYLKHFEFVSSSKVIVSNLSANLNFGEEKGNEIINFEKFDLFHDHDFIYCVNNISELIFSYNEQSLPTVLVDDNFLFRFDSMGNGSDFDINVTVTYSFTGSVMGALLFRLGSYYTENGSLWGKDFNPTKRIDDGYGYISTVSIRDIWVSGEGTYRVVAHPNDQKDLYETSTPPFLNEGSVDFRITRVKETLTCLISSTTGEPIISHTWTEGVTKPLNYLVIDFYLKHLEFVSSSKVRLTNISGTLNCKDSENTISPVLGVSSFGLDVSCLLIAIFLFIQRRRKESPKS
ncbi:MAG: hypothetical protein ACFFAE_19460 [Candidatus Hodarchaeota archaeon]